MAPVRPSEAAQVVYLDAVVVSNFLETEEKTREVLDMKPRIDGGGTRLA